MKDREMFPTVTEIIDGPVASIDRAYAFDRIRALQSRAARLATTP